MEIGEGQDVSPNQTPSDRVKARRAQVRKAQIEHRQRKADYVKHLEIDVSSIRDMIAATQKEVRLLKNRNNALRTRLVAGLAQPSPSLLEDQELAAGEPLHDFDMSLLDHDLHEVGLSLELDAAMSLPVYHVSSSKPSNSNCQATIALNPFSGLGNLETPSYLLSHLTPQQTQQTINYILT
jgi:hypothetical protein